MASVTDCFECGSPDTMIRCECECDEGVLDVRWFCRECFKALKIFDVPQEWMYDDTVTGDGQGRR